MAANYVRRKRLNQDQKNSVWRNGRWVEAYTRGSQEVTSVPVTADEVVKMISTAIDRQQYLHCAMLVNKMKNVTVTSIMSNVSLTRLHNTLPASLPLLEILYLKMFYSPEKEFIPVHLMTDKLVKKLITLFAQDDNNHTMLQLYRTHCRTIVTIIATVDGQFETKVTHRKEALDRCLRNMGQHGLVRYGSDDSFITLHDAFKKEMEKSISHLKSVVHHLWMSNKHSVIKLTTDEMEVSHQRMMQVNRDFVLERLYKNKSLLNSLEPIIRNQYFNNLIETLQHRIEYDKILLFHESELRKMSGVDQIEDIQIFQILDQFSKGYSLLLSIMTERRSTGQPFLSYEDNDVIKLNGQRNVRDDYYETKKQTNHTHFVDQSEGWSHVDSRTDSNRSSESKQNGEHVPLRHENRPNITIYDCSVRQNKNKLAEMEESKQRLNEPDRVSVLEMEVKSLREELAKSREQINHLLEQEKMLRERLADQVHNQFTLKSGHVFEDLSLGAQRPTRLIGAFHDLYREGRVDTLDALDVIPDLHGLDVLKMKILFSVVVLSFRCVQQTLLDLKSKLRQLLCLPVHQTPDIDPASSDMELSINNYLIKSVERYHLDPIVEEVNESIANTLYEFPGLKSCSKLKQFTEMTVKIAWGLSVQNPPFLILYESRKFQLNQHTRFHTSNIQLDDIKSFLWPSLIDGQNGECVSKGVVIT